MKPNHAKLEQQQRRQEMIQQVIDRAAGWLVMASIGLWGVILYHSFEKWVS
ncbi:MAG: hypothetical protein WAS33_02100 [Candidatus Promineifilaceae bacterium]